MSTASAVVLRHGTRRPLRLEARPDAPIVVGADLPGRSHGALLYAAGQAQTLGVELIVVRAWRPDRERRVDLEAAALAEAMAVCRAAAPEIAVTGRLLQGSVAEVLVQESTEAQLLVLGIRGTGHGPGTLLGPASRTIVREVCCPVAQAWLRETDDGATFRHLAAR